jgi:hypothetical protein
MPECFRLLVLSDVHYAGPGEQARQGYELRVIKNPLHRGLVWAWRHGVWLKDPLAHNHLLDRFCASAGTADLVVANGDYSCDSAFVGVSDDAASASARHVLARLRAQFPGRLAAVMGDHELGKMSLAGGVGGPRLASWERARGELGLEPFWQVSLGPWTCMGVTSTLLALPVYEAETLPAERARWRALRDEHLGQIRQALAALEPGRRWLLFCHDPTALPFLAEEPLVQQRLAQLETTVIGHLHTGLIFWLSRRLAGMPEIHGLGQALRRMSRALRKARCWRPFKVRLCPSLTGCELLKDGGFLEAELPADGGPVRWRKHPLPWARNPVPG